jgi:hypothetical protein
VTHRYVTPLAFKTAVEQRLQRQVSETRQPLHRLRQLLIFDRFLTRIFATFDQAVVLKGGVALELRLPGSRSTKDIDLRVMGSPEQTLVKLQEAGRLTLADYLTFEVTPDNAHHAILADGLQYEGRRYRVHARLADKIYGAAFGVDVAFAEPLHGTPQALMGTDFLRFAGIEPSPFWVYPVETHIAEKLHAYTLPRARPNSRVKDLPDMALLGLSGVISARALHSAIAGTFKHRNTHAVPPSLPPPPPTWEAVYARLAVAEGLRWQNISAVLDAVTRFINPVLGGHHGTWSPDRWLWQEGQQTDAT